MSPTPGGLHDHHRYGSETTSGQGREWEFLRSALENILQFLMDTDVSGHIKAAWHERTPDRSNYRNGYRERRLGYGVGKLQLHIPKLRRGSYFPEFLEPRRLTDKSLLAVIQKAWIQGPRARSKLLSSPWLVRHCEIAGFRCVQGGRVVSVAAIIATAVNCVAALSGPGGAGGHKGQVGGWGSSTTTRGLSPVVAFFLDVSGRYALRRKSRWVFARSTGGLP